MENDERNTEVLVVGGGLGGVAAALAALRLGRKVVLTEETNWIGGQMTAQGVPPDEHAWIETTGCTASYRRLRDRIRAYYRRNYPLLPAVRDIDALNPGCGNVSKLCHEPRVSLAVLEEMLAPYRVGRQLELLLKHRPVSAETKGDMITSVTLENNETGERVTIRALYILDATELGDLLPLAGVEHITGAESQAQTGELHARDDEPDPLEQQPFSWCFAIDYHPDKDFTIPKPAEYDFWRRYQAEFWPARQLSWVSSDPVDLQPVTRPIFSGPRTAPLGDDLWHYRRIFYTEYYPAGQYESDIIIVNWPQIDYWLGPLAGVSKKEADQHRQRSMQLSLSMMYWMQTEAPRPEGGYGYPGLRLRGDITGTSHGLAKTAYIRESRRILAEFTVLEQHVGVQARAGLEGAEIFPDTVGIGSYRIDLHPSYRRNYIDITSWPFQIPLGALIPVRVENLLPACKNLGVTHITNGCYRLHPVEWNIGEAAGALAAYCLKTGLTPRQIRCTPKHLADFQQMLQGLGVQLEWPEPIRLTPRIKTDPLGI